MATLGIDHINLKGAPALLEQLRDFYRDVVGLEVGPRPPFQSQGFWLYAGDKPIVHLSAREGEKRTTDSASYDHTAFSCTDFAQVCARLDAAGIAYETAEVPERNQRQVFCRDPAGNGVEFNFSLD